MALVAMSFFKPSFSIAQASKARKIQTPNTKTEFVDKSPKKMEVKETLEDSSSEESSSGSSFSQSAAPRQLRQHGLGLGLGQTFLFGNYGKYGQDKITADLLYTYAASYSFDLLVDAHWSKHKDNSDSMELMGLTGSMKGRIFEYDNFSTFLLGGLGFYLPQAERDGKDTTQKLTFGLNFGGGADLRLNEDFVIGVMAQLHWPFRVQQDVGSDLKGYYMKLLLTGMYLF